MIVRVPSGSGLTRVTCPGRGLADIKRRATSAAATTRSDNHEGVGTGCAIAASDVDGAERRSVAGAAHMGLQPATTSALIRCVAIWIMACSWAPAIAGECFDFAGSASTEVAQAIVGCILRSRSAGGHQRARLAQNGTGMTGYRWRNHPALTPRKRLDGTGNTTRSPTGVPPRPATRR